MRYLFAAFLLLSGTAFAESQAESKEGYWNSQGWYSNKNTQAAPVPANVTFKNYYDAISKQSSSSSKIGSETKLQQEIRERRVPLDAALIPELRTDVLTSAGKNEVDRGEKLNEAQRIARHGQAGATAEAAAMLIQGFGHILSMDNGERKLGVDLIAEAGRMYAVAGKFRVAADYNSRGRRILTRDYSQGCNQTKSKNCTVEAPFIGNAKLQKLENQDAHEADFGDEAISGLAQIFEANGAEPGVMNQLMTGELTDGDQILRALNLNDVSELKVPQELREPKALADADVNAQELAADPKALRDGRDLKNGGVSGSELKTLASLRQGAGMSLRGGVGASLQRLGFTEKDKEALRGKGLLKRASALRRGKGGADDDDLELGEYSAKSRRKKALEARLRRLQDEKQQLIVEGATAYTSLYDQGVQPARVGVHIFQLAHRHFRSFRKWRDEYTRTLVSRGLGSAGTKLKTAQVETSDLE